MFERSRELFRRFGLGSSDHQLLARASGYADLYGKSRFNSIAADLAFGPELRLGKSRLNVELGATQRWFGQEPFTSSARLGAIWTRPLGLAMLAAGVLSLTAGVFWMRKVVDVQV